jgi:hypothetical protein
VIVIGGTGVFGARLSAALAQDPGIDLVIAGRKARQTAAVAARIGARALVLDRGAPDLAERLAAEAPFAVIDAAGPFQPDAGKGHPVARAALAAGAHYLDLSDDATFTAGIAALDDEARGRGLVCLSGASSVPALSAAAVRRLGQGLTDIHLIDSMILPGNRAPRGLSVIQAILAQAGQPLAEWRGGMASPTRGWGRLARVDLGFGCRWSSPIGAPDLALFPQTFRARSVRFSAGLELSALHLGLWALALPVRAGLLRSLVPLARPLRWMADRLRPFGTDRGGMRVRVVGQTPDGRMEQRDWTLVAGSGDGPEVPAIPARALLAALIRGDVTPGARPCIADLDLALAEAEMARHDITTSVETSEFTPVFAQALGADWAALPPALQDLHRLADRRHWSGRARITRGTGRLARLTAWAMRFPAAAADVPVTVTTDRHAGHEVWTRNFAGQRFRSRLRPVEGGMIERFGPLSFLIDLTVRDDRLCYPVTRGWCLGLPLPRALLPVSDTVEAVDALGRATFDVALSHPLTGPIIRYRGWLTDAQSRK